MNTLNVNKAEFVKSAANPSGFIRSELPNIVFSGKRGNSLVDEMNRKVQKLKDEVELTRPQIQWLL